MRLLSEKLSDQPESHSDKEKMAEFSVPTWMVSYKFFSSVYIYFTIWTLSVPFVSMGEYSSECPGGGGVGKISSFGPNSAR